MHMPTYTAARSEKTPRPQAAEGVMEQAPLSMAAESGTTRLCSKLLGKRLGNVY